MSNRLELLKKKKIGQKKFEEYKNHFNDFSNLIHVDLEESEILLNLLSFPNFSQEFLNSTDSFIGSDLLKNIYQLLSTNSKAYAFTDDFIYCGIFLVNTKQAIEKAFKILKEDENHTFFILDINKEFFIKINYYDQLHHDYPLSFDIQVGFPDQPAATNS
jgi:hypothetical protein